ncbi:MAG: glycosyltransferase family 2 protein [Candidatus Omnitrophica bacterium]|nr:glycosyltransferase family 2 protein [Candidatus Omnitrophota bacterium]
MKSSPKPLICLTTVFIPREHIFFLEEWIRHHLTIGVQHIFLYDNGTRSGELRCLSTVYTPSPASVKLFNAGLTKRGEDYKLFTSRWTDDDITRMTREIVNKFPGRVSLIPWRHLGKEGRVLYANILAYTHHLGTVQKGSWTIFTDLDEFIWTGVGYTLPDIIINMDRMGCVCIVLNHKRFWCRYTKNGPVSSVYDIKECVDMNTYPVFSGKSIVKTGYVRPINTHKFYVFGNKAVMKRDVMRFNHYTLIRGSATSWDGKKYKIDQNDGSLKETLTRTQENTVNLKEVCEDWQPQTLRESLKFYLKTVFRSPK